MNTASLLRLACALTVALLMTTPSVAAEAACHDAGAMGQGGTGCLPAPGDMSLDRLMAGTCCEDNAGAECADGELAAAEELLAAQLRETGSALRHGTDGDRLLASLHTAQGAWERYREFRCELLTVPEASDAGEHAAVRERCRFELTVERILDLAEMQENFGASGSRVVQLY